MRIIPILRKNEETARMSIRNWAKRARKGEALLYHKGLLMKDRLHDPIANFVGRTIWELYSQGTVVLVQHRSGDADYEYLAIRS